MSKLHEVLAVESTLRGAASKLLEETQAKFKKSDYFTGFVKTLNMTADSPENTILENSLREERELPTTVVETLTYALQYWARAEDAAFQKHVTNQKANGDIFLNGKKIAENVPVDELLELEGRLAQIRKVFDAIPTLDAGKKWVASTDVRAGQYQLADAELTSKTEKTITPLVLYEATDKHPAQVEKVTTDKVIGTFTRQIFSGAATSKQKAEAIALVDSLLM